MVVVAKPNQCRQFAQNLNSYLHTNSWLKSLFTFTFTNIRTFVWMGVSVCMWQMWICWLSLNARLNVTFHFQRSRKHVRERVSERTMEKDWNRMSPTTSHTVHRIEAVMSSFGCNVFTLDKREQEAGGTGNWYEKLVAKVSDDSVGRNHMCCTFTLTHFVLLLLCICFETISKTKCHAHSQIHTHTRSIRIESGLFRMNWNLFSMKRFECWHMLYFAALYTLYGLRAPFSNRIYC